MQTARRESARNGFDYTRAIWNLADNICQNCSLVSHIDMRLIAVEYARCRNDHDHGTLATLTALREGASVDDASQPGSDLHRIDNGESLTETVAAVDVDGRPAWYLLTIFMPRFANLSFREKLVTLAHELWHVSDACDGRLRRFPGRCSIHGRSEKEFDKTAESIIDRWLTTNPPAILTEFLRVDLDQLVNLHGSVIGQQFNRPRQRAR